MRHWIVLGALTITVTTASCGGGGGTDTGGSTDTGPGTDGGGVDTGGADGGGMTDTGGTDGGGTEDTGGTPDAGTDAGGPDSGLPCDGVDCTSLDTECTMGVCNPDTGSCEPMDLPAGTSCDDGDLCTDTDVCTAGACSGTAIDCSGSSDTCNDGVCDPATGACVAMPANEGDSCDDMMACTTGDVCTGGLCGGGAVPSSCTCPAMLPETAGVQTFSGTTVGGGSDANGGCGLSGASADVTYQFTLTARRRVRIEVIDADYDTVLHVRTACATDASTVTCNDDNPNGTTTNSRIDRVMDAGTYTLVVDGYDGEAGAFTVEMELGDVPRTCLGWRDLGVVGNGVYSIQPGGVGTTEFDVRCDMTTDGGGWTLVQSTRTAGPSDQATAYHANLTTLAPAAAVSSIGVWDGLRGVITSTSDIRFSCEATPTSTTMTVDLSFYNNDWYREITQGTEAASCFQENNGAGEDRPTYARRNNVTGAVLPVGNLYSAVGFGYLEGEDICDDPSDFTVDFDDRGMDSNQGDGTDWGMDDGTLKCGTNGLTDGAWFIWVRERPEPHGHVILIGHDYFERSTNADRVVGNAVLHANDRGTVNVLVYQEFADLTGTGESVNTRAAITSAATAASRTVAFTDLTTSGGLEAGLAGQDVLLILEQESSPGDTMLEAIGTTWAPTIAAFVERGGVVVVCEYADDSHLLIPGYFTIGTVTDTTSAALTVPAPIDTVAEGVAAYTATNGSAGYPMATGGTAAVLSGTTPVVLHTVR